MHRFFKNLTKNELKVFKKLSTPQKIQDFLDNIPINFEKRGDTLFSPRKVLEQNSAHCFEGALFASAILFYHGGSPIILDLKTDSTDESHVVALFKQNKYWGAISKTNHAVLRYRDALYKNPRELVMSYFHEYFLNSGEKTLRSYAILNLKKIKENWVTSQKDLWKIDKLLDKQKHTKIVLNKDLKFLRKAHPIEIKAGKLVIWKK